MGLEVFMPIVPGVSAKPVCDCSHTATSCSYGEACPGFASRENCPPLIVIAVQAMVQDALGIGKAA